MRYHWLLFDADGTLFDYDAAEAQALRSAFSDVGLPYQDGALVAYRRFNGAVWSEFEQGSMSAATLRLRRFELLFAELGHDVDVPAFSPLYLGHLAEGVQLLDGAEAVVRALHGRAHMTIITNGLKDVQRPRFARSALDGLFDHVVISDEIGAAKPTAAFFEHTFDVIGRPPKERVLVVGDSLTSDIRGGNDFGVDTCWYNPAVVPADPRYPPTHEIRSLDELYALVGVENGAGTPHRGGDRGAR
jgi:2-haloacid dehalogenase